MARISPAPKTFDDAKLAGMTEPLTVRIERIKSGARTPIPLPEGEGPDGQPLPAGADYGKDEIRGIEEWLVTKWAGGGLYEITVTDSAPTPNVLRWQPFWNPSDYPELTPPPLAAARAQGQNPLPPQASVNGFQPPPQQQVQRPMAFPNGFPPGGVPQYQGYYPQQPQQGYAQPYGYPLPAPPPIGTPQWSTWQAEADKRTAEVEKRRVDDELRRMRDEAATRDRDALNAKHQAELEREKMSREQADRETKAQLADMRAMITSLGQTIATASTTNRPDPAIEALKEQNRILAERAETERREREADKRDRETRELIARQNDEATRRFEAMQRNFEQTIATMNANKSDPMMLFMQEQARVNAEAIKEVARTNQATIDRMQANQMRPQDLLILMKDSQAGVEASTDRVTKFFGNVVEMQQKVTENLLNMQPGGSGVVDVIREGVGGLKEFAERYAGLKSTEQRLATQAQVQMADSQARAMEAQAYAAAAASGQPLPQVHVPPPPRTEAQLAGPAVPPAGATVTPINSGKKKKGKKASAEVTGEATKRLGRTDLEWFTNVAIDEIVELREGVAHFIESCKMDPPRKTKKGDMIEGTSPEQAADGILLASQMVMQQGVKIPAMDELLFQERFADFLDVLLPEAPQTFRDDTVQHIITKLKKLTGAEPTPVVTESEDDDEDDDDDAEDEKAG